MVGKLQLLITEPAEGMEGHHMEEEMVPPVEEEEADMAIKVEQAGLMVETGIMEAQDLEG